MNFKVRTHTHSSSLRYTAAGAPVIKKEIRRG